METNLEHIRDRINQIDEKLVQLLNERAKAALQIGELKANLGIKAYDPARERVVLEHISTLNGGPLGKGAVEEIFASIITACREIQSR